MILVDVLLLIVGFVALIKGADWFVDGSSALAKTFRVPGLIIGLTIVAIGTSLPELVTSIVAAQKGETGMAVGNVVGSNIFNMFFILGVSSAIHSIGVNMASVWDLMLLTIISIIVFSLTKKTINRKEGCVMLFVYIADMVFAAFR